jgi:hypothetical protein
MSIWRTLSIPRLSNFKATGSFKRILKIKWHVLFVAVLDALLRSHHELRGALILPGRHIHKLSFGRRSDQALPILRRVLKEPRAVARQFRNR